MKSILRATTILGAASLVPVGVGLVSAKAWAQLVGPAGYGLVGLVQSLVSMALLVMDLGISTALLKRAAPSIVSDPASARGLWRASLLAAMLPVFVGTAALVLGRTWIARSTLGGEKYTNQVLFCALAVVLSIGSGLGTAMLNAHQRVGALARIGALGAIFPAAATLTIALVFGIDGIAAGVAAGALVRLAIVSLLLWKETQLLPWSRGEGPHTDLAFMMLRSGTPLALSQLASTGMHFAVPALVLHLLGRHEVGYFQAAYAIAMGSLGFLLAAFSQDYFPRVSAAVKDATALRALVNDQHRLVLLMGFPLILLVKAAAPFMIPMLYSAQFAPAQGILNWLLTADLLKFSSWTLSYLILARCSSRVFLFTEVLAGLSLALGIWLGTRYFGADGIGIGFVFSYLVYWVVTWTISKQRLAFRWELSNLAALGMALFGAACPQILGRWFGRPVEIAAAFAVAGLAAMFAARGLLRVWRMRSV